MKFLNENGKVVKAEDIKMITSSQTSYIFADKDNGGYCVYFAENADATDYLEILSSFTDGDIEIDREIVEVALGNDSIKKYINDEFDLSSKMDFVKVENWWDEAREFNKSMFRLLGVEDLNLFNPDKFLKQTFTKADLDAAFK